MHSLIGHRKYPVFVPPAELAEKTTKEWSKSEATHYFDWFLGVLDERVAGLLSFLGLDSHSNPETLLHKVDSKVKDLLQDEQFFCVTPNGKKLTNEGYALAADIGLLLAKLLITNANGKVYWEILRKPKTERSFNLPVLRGFGTMYLDPVAGSIGDVAWILRGNENEDASLRTFQFWLAKVNDSSLKKKTRGPFLKGGASHL